MVPSFDPNTLESLCRILGDTQRGFTGSEIGRLLAHCQIIDLEPNLTKWIRLFEALKARQASDGCANHVAAFIEYAMAPARHHDEQEWYEDTRAKLNMVLAFSGYELMETGKLVKVAKAQTISEARSRASTLREALGSRRVHHDVLKFCKDELLVDNYFHAVFEATKSVAEKIRTMTGLSSDGADLVDEAFSFGKGTPYLALNSLQTESEQSEQRGFMNLLKGLFGTFRNTTAHAPKITWRIEEQDALDILSLVSLVHRRLDESVPARSLMSRHIP